MTHVTSSPAAPPLDPELAAALALQLGGDPSPIGIDDVAVKRAEEAQVALEVLEQIKERDLVVVEGTATSHDGAHVPVSVVHRKDRGPSSPVILYIHGGGMMMGNRWSGADVIFDWVEHYNAVVATVEYRLAPEHPFPAPQEDCYAALVWLEESSRRLGVNLEAGLVAGISAGAGLAASVCLMARDRGGPRVGGQLLLAPMLDDRNDSVSARQFPRGMWNRQENELGWRSLLGPLHGADDVPYVAAPARCADLRGLSPAFIEVGSAEVFRDEAVEYASKLWAAGGEAELHVWAGGFHGFQTFDHTALARASAGALRSWMDRRLGFTGRA